MKKTGISLILALLLLSGERIYAQQNSFGILLGIGASNIHLSDVTQISKAAKLNSPLFSYSANGDFAFRNKGNIGFSLEPGYIQKGGVQQNDQQNGLDNIKYKIHYVQMPVTFDWYLKEKLKLSVGPEFALLLNAIIDYGSDSYDYTIYFDHHFEISGLIGLQYIVAQDVSIGLRYNHGVTSISNITFTDLNGNPIGVGKKYNQYIQFLMRFEL